MGKKGTAVGFRSEFGAGKGAASGESELTAGGVGAEGLRTGEVGLFEEEERDFFGCFRFWPAASFSSLGEDAGRRTWVSSGCSSDSGDSRVKLSI